MEFLLALGVVAVGYCAYRKYQQHAAKAKAEKAVAEAKDLNGQ